MVSKRFYKWLKMFEKGETGRKLPRKLWNHAINLREEFIPKKRKIYLLIRIQREEV